MNGTRTYQAYTMAEALAAVKYDLGSDAIILSTRTFKRGGLLGLGRRTVVEVTASNTREAGNASAPSAPGAPRAPRAANAPAVARTPGVPPARTVNGPAGSPSTSASGSSGRTAGGQTIAARGAAVQALASEADRQRNRRLNMAAGAPSPGNVALADPRVPRPQQSNKPAASPTAMVKAPVAAASVPSPAGSSSPSPSMHHAGMQGNEVGSRRGIEQGPASVTGARISSSGSTGHGTSSGSGGLVVTVPATPMSVAAKRFILRSPDAVNRASTSGSGATAVGAEKWPTQPFGESATSQTPSSVATHHESPPPAGIVSIGAPAPQAASYAPPMRHATPRTTSNEVAPQLTQELAAIKSMVGQVLQRQTAVARTHTPSMPPKLFDVYLRLVGHDVPDELADVIVNDMREQLSEREANDERALRAAAIEHLADHIAVAPTSLSSKATDGRPLTIALVGPTGVGKTTTLAKLAASFKLKSGRSVGLITADTYRIAAVDQLRTYANIIGLPLQVVLTPADMRQALQDLSECEVVLVDTAGRSQKDAMRIAELRQFIDAARPHEVHMVLSATAGEKVLLSEAEAFARVGVNRLILTKTDEAASLGGLMNLLRTLNKPLSFITTGQEVPDHLEPANARRVAELILGEEGSD